RSPPACVCPAAWLRCAHWLLRSRCAASAPPRRPPRPRASCPRFWPAPPAPRSRARPLPCAPSPHPSPPPLRAAVLRVPHARALLPAYALPRPPPSWRPHPSWPLRQLACALLPRRAPTPPPPCVLRPRQSWLPARACELRPARPRSGLSAPARAKLPPPVWPPPPPCATILPARAPSAPRPSQPPPIGAP